MNRRTFGALGALVAACFLAAPAAAAAAATPSPAANPALRMLSSETTSWMDSATGRCLDSNAAGKVYTTNPCQAPGNHYQEWVVTDYEFAIEPGSWIYVDQIRNLATGRCLDSNTAGQLYTTSPCQTPGNYYQLWYSVEGPSSGNTLKWMNYQTGRYLDSNTAGSAYASDPNGGDFQNWVKG